MQRGSQTHPLEVVGSQAEPEPHPACMLWLCACPNMVMLRCSAGPFLATGLGAGWVHACNVHSAARLLDH